MYGVNLKPWSDTTQMIQPKWYNPDHDTTSAFMGLDEHKPAQTSSSYPLEVGSEDIQMPPEPIATSEYSCVMQK